MLSNVLRLDASGAPIEWIGLERAAGYLAKDMVLWSLGDARRVLRGGSNKMGVLSVLEVPSIMAIKGKTRAASRTRVISLERNELFRRDRNMCAYCGEHFKSELLEMEHVLPESRGGQCTWTNIVSACRHCNAAKSDRTPEEACMPLLYVPYVPNIYEGLILQGRKILADQMQYLMQGVPRHSRLHQDQPSLQ